VLTIRKEQLDALALAAMRATAPTRARERVSVRGGDEQKLTAIADEAIVRAWGYGLRKESDIRAFVQLAFSVSPAFDEYPPFRTILERGGPDPSANFARLLETATAEDWDAAAANHDTKP